MISKVYVLKVDLEYLKTSRELYNGYSLPPDKTEIKTKMLPDYPLKTANLYNIRIYNAKKLVPNFSDMEK